MKKIYTLLTLLLVGAGAMAQTTVTVNATGTTGSYKTGYVRNTAGWSINDNNLQVKYGTTTGATRRGWAVFDLTGLIPSGATVTAVNIRFRKSNVATTGTPPVAITGYNGDMSTLVATPATVYANCNSGTAFNTTTWGGTTGVLTLPFNSTGVTFINTAAAGGGSIISIGFSATGTPTNQTYTINGHGGTAAQIPQLQITYSCDGVSGVAASVSSPVCIGSSFSLTGNATGAATYSWSGPGAFSSTDQNPIATAGASSSGTYTFTAYNALGCPTTSTVSVTTNTSPSAISGNANVCFGQQSTLSSSPAGTWSISGSTGAAISTGGVFTPGTTAGTSTVTYSLPSGCYKTLTVNTLDTPSAIVLPSSMCSGVSTTLTSSPAGGTWTVNPSSVAAINPVSGVLVGSSVGTANVTYTGINGCSTVNSTNITVPPSSTITSSTGAFSICPLLSLTLSNTVTGGTWSVSGSNGIINSSSGYFTGLSIGSVPVTYSNICGIATTTVNVAPPPPAITGVFSACVNATSTLHDSATGGVWSSHDPLIAAAAAGWGTVTGVSAGTTTITYTDVSGCIATTPFTVHALPDTIQGITNTCVGSTVTLFDTSANGSWSSANSMIASVDASGGVHGINAATTTITYTVSTHGCYVTKNFTVNPLPVAISGRNSLCALKSDTLFDLSLGGTWSSGTPGIAAIGSTTGIWNAVSAGTAIITYTLPTGCYRTRPVTVHLLPAPPVTYNWATQTFTTGTYYTSYQWYYNNNPIAGAVSYNLGATENGGYAVLVTDTNGCENMSTIYNLTSVGVNGPSLENAVTIVPNPTSGELSISAPVSVNAVVTGLEGKVVMKQGNATSLDLSSLPDGMYMILLFDENGQRVATRKIIKQQ